MNPVPGPKPAVVVLTLVGIFGALPLVWYGLASVLWPGP